MLTNKYKQIIMSSVVTLSLFSTVAPSLTAVVSADTNSITTVTSMEDDVKS